VGNGGTTGAGAAAGGGIGRGGTAGSLRDVTTGNCCVRGPGVGAEPIWAAATSRALLTSGGGRTAAVAGGGGCGAAGAGGCGCGASGIPET
jgi:hypothetical protein